MKYINLTPRWTEILPTWLMMYRQAATGDCTNPSLVMSNATEELTRMAQAADYYGDLIAWLKLDEWTDGQIEIALSAGRACRESDRTTVKESES